ASALAAETRAALIDYVQTVAALLAPAGGAEPREAALAGFLSALPRAPNEVAYSGASLLRIAAPLKQALLEEPSLVTRLGRVLDHLRHEQAGLAARQPDEDDVRLPTGNGYGTVN